MVSPWRINTTDVVTFSRRMSQTLWLSGMAHGIDAGGRAHGVGVTVGLVLAVGDLVAIGDGHGVRVAVAADVDVRVGVRVGSAVGVVPTGRTRI